MQAVSLVRKFSSDDKPLKVDIDTLRFPTYWLRPFQPLENEPECSGSFGT